MKKRKMSVDAGHELANALHRMAQHAPPYTCIYENGNLDSSMLSEINPTFLDKLRNYTLGSALHWVNFFRMFAPRNHILGGGDLTLTKTANCSENTFLRWLTELSYKIWSSYLMSLSLSRNHDHETQRIAKWPRYSRHALKFLFQHFLEFHWHS